LLKKGKLHAKDYLIFLISSSYKKYKKPKHHRFIKINGRSGSFLEII